MACAIRKTGVTSRDRRPAGPCHHRMSIWWSERPTKAIRFKRHASAGRPLLLHRSAAAHSPPTGRHTACARAPFPSSPPAIGVFLTSAAWRACIAGPPRTVRRACTCHPLHCTLHDSTLHSKGLYLPPHQHESVSWDARFVTHRRDATVVLDIYIRSDHGRLGRRGLPRRAPRRPLMLYNCTMSCHVL